MIYFCRYLSEILKIEAENKQIAQKLAADFFNKNINEIIVEESIKNKRYRKNK